MFLLKFAEKSLNFPPFHLSIIEIFEHFFGKFCHFCSKVLKWLPKINLCRGTECHGQSFSVKSRSTVTFWLAIRRNDCAALRAVGFIPLL